MYVPIFDPGCDRAKIQPTESIPATGQLWLLGSLPSRLLRLVFATRKARAGFEITELTRALKHDPMLTDGASFLLDRFALHVRNHNHTVFHQFGQERRISGRHGEHGDRPARPSQRNVEKPPLLSMQVSVTLRHHQAKDRIISFQAREPSNHHPWQQYVVGEMNVTLILCLYGVADIVSNLILSKRVKDDLEPLFRRVLVTMAVSMCVLSVFGNLTWAVQLAILIVASSHAGVSLLIGIDVLKRAGNAGQLINAINVSMINLGIGIGAVITGLLVDRVGVSSIGWVGACFIALALCVRWKIERSFEQHNGCVVDRCLKLP